MCNIYFENFYSDASFNRENFIQNRLTENVRTNNKLFDLFFSKNVKKLLIHFIYMNAFSFIVVIMFPFRITAIYLLVLKFNLLFIILTCKCDLKIN